MVSRRLPLLALALVLLAACGNSNGGGGSDILRLPALHAAPDLSGGRIVDAEGREVLLRGVNVNALAEYWQSRDFPTTFPLTESDAMTMAAIGWNTVRLLLSWSRVEPEPGVYDQAYLGEVDGAVTLLARHGIYSIIDLHQDAWSATLAARPDEMCAENRPPAFGWDGAPAWATLDGGASRCTIAGIRETSPAVLASFAAFWSDDPGPGAVGVRTRYVRMLGEVATRYARESAVAGYDLMNEPNAFGTAQLEALADLYADALAEIRAREDAAGGFHHLVFFEPSALWSAVGSGPPPDFARDPDVVYAPHIYTGGFTGGPITAAAFDIARSEAAGFGGAPVLSGEWGADPRRAENAADGYFLTHQRLQDEFRIGATLWTWRESCGDPHKAGEYRAGQTPYVWGEFEVDCTSNTVTGMRTPLVTQLTRGYVRAAPGQLLATQYDPASGSLSASGTTGETDVELLAFYPASLHGPRGIAFSGFSAVDQIAAPGGNVYLAGRSLGGQWSLTVQ